MNPYITTYTGEPFDPFHPVLARIRIEDIAHALSYLCRGNGHVSTFFSVASHSILCAREAQARGYDRRLVLACLLHDASECYLSDVPRPIKARLSDYIQVEENLLSAIYTRFLGSPLNEREKALVKEVDDSLLYYDLKELLGVSQETPPPRIHVQLDYSFVPFARVEEEFLSLFEQCQAERSLPRVPLDALLDVLMEEAGGFQTYLDRYEGTLLTLPRLDNLFIQWTDDQLDAANRVKDSSRYLPLPGSFGSKREGEISEAFLQEILDPRQKLFLSETLNCPHPTREFRKAISHAGLMDQYKDFRREQLKADVVVFCQEHDIPYNE